MNEKLAFSALCLIIILMGIMLFIETRQECYTDIEVVERDNIQKVTDNVAVAWRTQDEQQIDKSIEYLNLYMKGI